jgi:hypothetical protein
MPWWSWLGLGYLAGRNRSGQPEPESGTPLGYLGWLSAGVILTSFGVLWLVLVWGHPVLVVPGVVWLLVSWFVAIGGCMAVRQDRHALPL